jgi:multidrug transporter EmrE-like cation transporter
LITVILTAIMDGIGSLPSRAALLSLLPIALGIAGASWSSPAFETIGFLAALVSTTSQSCLNVYSKRAILATGVSGPAAQRCMVTTGLGIALLYNSLRWHRNDSNKAAAPARPVWVTASAVVAYHIEYVLSFSFVRLVQPVTYGCIDAIRRLATILSGRYMFGSAAPLTRVNIVGIALALLGAIGYSIASTTAGIPK